MSRAATVAMAVSTMICAASAFAAGGAKEDWLRIYLGNDPVVTRDGRSFYFTWNDRIWLAPTAGGTARMVSPPAARALSPCLSRDGSRLAFQCDCDGAFFVYECPTSGGPVRQVTFHTELTRPWCYTPDGGSLVCTVRRDDAGEDYSLRIAVVPVARRGAENMLFDTFGTSPSLSPDGKSLLFVRGTGSRAPFRKRRRSTTQQKGEIWLYDIAAKSFKLMLERPYDVRDAVWAPDGKSFLFLSSEGGIRNLARMNVADGRVEALTKFSDEHVERASVSGDGKTVVFRQGLDFWRLDVAASNAVPCRIAIRPESGYVARPPVRRRIYDRISNVDEEGSATFCCDGMQTAFTAGGSLWVMDTEIRRPRKVDGGARAFARYCAFSPDGALLYYVVDRGDGSDVRVARRADPSKGWWENEKFNVQTLVSDGEVRSRFSLSPDGTRLAWQDPNGRLSFAGTNGVVKSRGPLCNDAATYAWSPDGRWVAASFGDINGDNDVWIVSVDGVREPYNVSRNFMWDGAPAWCPDGKLLAFGGECAEENGGERLFYVYLCKADEERETFDKRYEEARKKAAGSREPEKKLENKPLQKPEQKPEAASPALGRPAVKDSKAAIVANGKKGRKGRKGRKPFLKKPAEVKQQAEKPQVAKSQAAQPPAEKPQAAKPAGGPPAVKIDFDGLCDRVHMLQKVPIVTPFFSHDSRTIAFASGGRTMKVHVPDRMTPQKLFDKTGRCCAWIAKGDRALRVVNGHPAHGDVEFLFRAYDEIDVGEWLELAFRTAWARIRDRFYDDGCHGADWAAMKGRYLDAARHATGYAAFRTAVEMMLGELDASHLALRSTPESMREWEPQSAASAGWTMRTAHLGLRFDRNWKGRGWKVRDVVKGGPADLSSFDFRKGDVLLSIDGVALNPDDDPTLALNGPVGRVVMVEVAPRQTKKPDARPTSVRLQTVSFSEARAKLGEECLREKRRYVHSKSGGKLGYLNIAEMNMKSFWLFQQEMFSEGYGRDGLIIDVRGNGGGYTADKVLSILVGANHARVHARGYGLDCTGYPISRWERPLWSRPIVVMCDEDSASNAEILTHAVKTLKRGRVVGVQTGGNVISTFSRSLLDLGVLRDPHRGWYLPDGTDMEWNGAMPDVVVKNTPADLVRGHDAQLEAAVKVLAEDVEKAKKGPPPVPCRPAR